MSMHRQRGTAMVESAIFLPLFLLVLFGIIWAVQSSVQSERVQIAVRYGGLVSNEAAPYVGYSLYGLYVQAAAPAITNGCIAPTTDALTNSGTFPGPQSNTFWSPENGQTNGTCSKGQAVLTGGDLSNSIVFLQTTSNITYGSNRSDAAAVHARHREPKPFGNGKLLRHARSRNAAHLLHRARYGREANTCEHAARCRHRADADSGRQSRKPVDGRLLMSTYALAIPESYTPRPAAYGTRAQLSAPTGDVEGYLALAGCDKRAGTASYALRIVNQSDRALRARMTCATLRGESILAYPLDVHVAPFSISETLLPVRVADVGPYDRAIVNVEGGEIAFSLEAPAPSRAGRRSRWMIYAILAVLLSVAAACAAGLSTPRLALLAAPRRTFAGTAIDVPYAFGGWAAMQYALQTPDGRQLAAGMTGAHEGTLQFTVPSSAGNDVVLSVNVTGLFGHTSTTRTIAIAPQVQHRAARSPLVPRITAFAVSPNVRAGDTLRVNYITNARDGEVWLIDDTGTLWARQPVNGMGETDLEIPQQAAGRQMRVVLHARIAGTDAVASAVVLVSPGSVKAQPAAGAGTASIALSSAAVAPGQNFTVNVSGDHTDAQIVLADSSGNQIEQADVPADQSSATLTAPSTASQRTYYVTATISQGVSQETVVRKLTVAPSN